MRAKLEKEAAALRVGVKDASMLCGSAYFTKVVVPVPTQPQQPPSGVDTSLHPLLLPGLALCEDTALMDTTLLPSITPLRVSMRSSDTLDWARILPRI